MSVVRLGEHAKLIRGITFKPRDKCDPGDEKAVVCMRTKNVQTILDESDLIAVPENIVKNPEKMLSAGDILVSSANSWNLVGKCCQVPKLQYPSTAGGFISILRRKTQKLESSYLYRWFSSDLVQSKLRSFANQTTNISNLDHKRTLDLHIPLPPLPEQKRIAGILDAADALRAKRRETLAQLDTLLQSTFLDMFGDPVTNPMSWPKVALGAHASKIGSGATPMGGEAAYKKDGIALIRSKNVRDGHFSQNDLAFIDDQQAARLDGVVVEHDDVLLNITGASVARACRAPHHVLPARVNQHVAIIRLTENFDQIFLERCLLSPSMKRRLLGIAGVGATREAITKNAIKRLAVIRPPRNDQSHFATIAQSIEHQKTTHRAHLAELDTLFTSLQSRAFRGEL